MGQLGNKARQCDDADTGWGRRESWAGLEHTDTLGNTDLSMGMLGNTLTLIDWETHRYTDTDHNTELTKSEGEGTKATQQLASTPGGAERTKRG